MIRYTVCLELMIQDVLTHRHQIVKIDVWIIELRTRRKRVLWGIVHINRRHDHECRDSPTHSTGIES